MRSLRLAAIFAVSFAALTMSAHAEQDSGGLGFSTSLIDALQTGGGSSSGSGSGSSGTSTSSPSTPGLTGTILRFEMDLNAHIMYAVMSDGSRVPMNSQTTTTTPVVLHPVAPAVPEPGTAALMALGIVAIAVRAARRKA